MRLVTGISIASLVISVVTLALVLMLFVTKEPKESFDAQMTRHRLYDLLSQHPYLDYSAKSYVDYTNALRKYESDSENAWPCLYKDKVFGVARRPTYEDDKWRFT